MKKSQIALLVTVIGFGAVWINAQEGRPGRSGAVAPDGEDRDFRPPPHRHGHRPPPPPVMVVLDANHDGKLDAQEIANAVEALKKLDKNGDGELTFEELRPPFPPDFPPPDDEGDGFCPDAFEDGTNPPGHSR